MSEPTHCVYVEGAASCSACGKAWGNVQGPVWRICQPPCRFKGPVMGALLTPCCGGQGKQRIPVYACGGPPGTCTERPTAPEAMKGVEYLAAGHRPCLACPHLVAR